MRNLATSYAETGRSREALELRQLVPIPRRKVFGPGTLR
jgi:hypothetical protein